MAILRTGPRAGGQFNYIRFVLRLRIPLAVATMGFAVLGLVASFAGVNVRLGPLGGGAATHPLTAICLFGIGLSVFFLKRFGQVAIWRYVVGAMIIAICASRLMQAELTQTTGAPGLDIFGPIAGFSGRFSVESAITLGAFAMAVVLRQGLGRWGVAFLLIGFGTIYNTLLEISYGLTFFNGDVGAFSLLGLLCAAVAMMTTYVHRPLLRVLFMIGNIGSQTRIIALTAVIVPWVCGYFLHIVRDIGPNAVPFEAAEVSVITWSMLMMLLISAARLENTDVARHRAQRELAMMRRIDPQTKALKRGAMSELLDAAWVDHKATGTQFGTLLLDVDYFRRLNETFGHDSAENVLERVAATLQPQLRDHDAMARWNSEEFLILLKIKAESDLDIVAQRLRAALQDKDSPFCAGLDGEPMHITAHFGGAVLRHGDQGPSDMITRADTALHLAKIAARHRVEIGFDLDTSNDTLVFRDDEDEGRPDVIAA